MQIFEDDLLTYEELTSFITKKIKYLYDSYDHKLAVEDFKLTDEYKRMGYGAFNYLNKIDSYDLPKIYKEKFLIKKTGTLRKIRFLGGAMYKFDIGNRYSKVFYSSDFGRSVKPIIHPDDDKYDLIRRGFAVSILDM